MYYVFRVFLEIEKRYVVIEEKVLVVIRVCEKFINYIFGMKFIVEIDYKLLVFFFILINFFKMLLYILRFRMYFMKYKVNFVFSY